MPSTTTIIGQRPDSASVMKMWKVYLILWKFKQIIKERAARKKPNDGNKMFNRMLKEAWVEEQPTKVTVGSTSYQQSFTRQLAFGNLEREYKSSNALDFYNSSVFSLIAKILTVVILLITALLMVFFYETSYNT